MNATNIVSQRMIETTLQEENIAEDKRLDWIQAHRDAGSEETFARLRLNRSAFLSVVDTLIAVNVANEQNRHALHDPTTFSGQVLNEANTPLPITQSSHDTAAPIDLGSHAISEIGILGTRNVQRPPSVRPAETDSKYSPQEDYGKPF